MAWWLNPNLPVLYKPNSMSVLFNSAFLISSVKSILRGNLTLSLSVFYFSLSSSRRICIHSIFNLRRLWGWAKWQLQHWTHMRRYSFRRHTERWKTSPMSGGTSSSRARGSETTGSGSASPIPNSIYLHFSMTTTSTTTASPTMLSMKVKTKRLMPDPESILSRESIDSVLDLFLLV